ncbi:MAG: hypothetical protein GY801_22010 [bacterium]|nr:hypothetical protein [bacterium]
MCLTASQRRDGAARLKLSLLLYEKSMQLLQTGESLKRILASPIRAKLSRIKESPFDDFHEEFEQLLEGLNNLALS